MVKVHVPYLGTSEQCFDKQTGLLSVEDGTTMGDVIDHFGLHHYAVMVNYEYTEDDYVLQDDDWIIMLPTGG